MTFTEKSIKYFLNLKPPQNLPSNIEVMNPYTRKETRELFEKFCAKFFNDDNKRLFAFGINPGRFGGGVTGISFTDPVALEKHCGIENDLPKKEELSSKFIYSFIDEYGGTEIFYRNCFLSALYPLALIKDGKNYNYYDDTELYVCLKDDIIKNISAHIEFGARRDVAVSLGIKNGKYLEELNSQYKFFDKIISLDHPRFIMQYRRKKLDEYISAYLNVFRSGK